MRGFKATCDLVLAKLHVTACTGTEEDGVAYRSYESVGDGLDDALKWGWLRTFRSSSRVEGGLQLGVRGWGRP